MKNKMHQLLICSLVFITLFAGCKQTTENKATQPPQKFVDYMKSRDQDDSLEILFYAEEDLDLDGKKEVIVASGTRDAGEPLSTNLNQIYVLQEHKGEIVQLGDNLVQDIGYFAYEVKLIQLQNMPQKYIYIGLSKGADGPLKGFSVLSLSNHSPEVVTYSASGSGSGEDELIDADHDGQYDGYVQRRTSYDVLYHPLTRTYLWKDGQFKFDRMQMEIPEYPADAKETIIQFLTMYYFKEENSPEVEKRLSELSVNHKAIDLQMNSDDLFDALYQTAMENEQQMKFDIKENAVTATATISYQENQNKFQLYVQLVKSNGRWQIDKIKL